MAAIMGMPPPMVKAPILANTRNICQRLIIKGLIFFCECKGTTSRAENKTNGFVFYPKGAFMPRRQKIQMKFGVSFDLALLSSFSLAE
jgi:hypothetical protein